MKTLAVVTLSLTLLTGAAFAQEGKTGDGSRPAKKVTEQNAKTKAQKDAQKADSKQAQPGDDRPAKTKSPAKAH